MLDCRITPAHAGKSHFPIRQFRFRWDHPRTRGEKLIRAFASSLLSGSPPHTRGKGRIVYLILTGMRITPAHAGKSAVELQELKYGQDHPRTRGEKTHTEGKKKTRQGSPPHTRGKVNAILKRSGGSGITPAHAGKSQNSMIYKIRSRDHPRTRGEKCT